jgi:hypothetical protein
MVKKGTLSGINWALVGVGYLFLFVVTAVLFFSRYMWRRRSYKAENKQILSIPLREAQIVDLFDEE